jgi:hypothetical protein
MSKLRLKGSTSGFTELTASAVAGDNTITLPSGNGSANQLLKNSGTAGTLAFAAATEDSSGNFAFNAGFGSVAPAFGCRAWVNFSATGGTITVEASGGVSSVTRNSAGDHTINLSTTMPDTDFCVNVTSGSGFTGHSPSTPSTTSTEIETRAVATPHASGDAGRNLVTIHR